MKTNLLFKLSQRFFALLFILTLPSVGNMLAQGAGNKLTFDGVDDLIIIPSNSGGDLNPLDSITLECWVNLKKAPSTEHRPHLLSKMGSFALIIENNGQARFFINDGTNWHYVSGTSIIKANKWHHIVGTYNGDSLRIYVNGKEDGTPTNYSGSMVVNDEDFKIGNRYLNYKEEALNGRMDEVRTWTRTRTESEIQKSMNARLKGDEPGLVGYWRLDNTSGSVATDSSPFENNGTLTNMDTTTVWNASGAPLGNYSSYAISDDITSNIDCTVDVIFGTDDNAAGDNYVLAAVQINDKPNRSTGLVNVSDQHWQLWSENSVFDGTFSATVNFHYDNISGIDDETQLELYRRQHVLSPTWEIVKGYTIEPGSSNTDGKGYIQWVISQDTVGGFSGQYIVSGSNPLLINETVKNIGLNLYPNPNKGSFEVSMELENLQNVDIEVLSISGKLIWKEIYLNQMGMRKFPIDINEQAKGIYFLRVTTEAGSFTKQLIIQ